MLATIERGDLALIEHPIAQELLQACVPARLAYIAPDSTPRVVPVLFHWGGQDIIVTSWPDDYKVAAIMAHPEVAITIDTNEPPFKVLSIRGRAAITVVDGIVPECHPIFTRYFGAEGGQAWINRMAQITDQMARIAIRPTWVDVLDFETRLPAGMTRRMA